MTTSLPCYHVTASNGLIYGVSAHSKREAFGILQDRLLTEDDGGARPLHAERVGTWDAPYGTTLCYGEV